MRKPIMTVFFSVTILFTLLVSGCAMKQMTSEQNPDLAAIEAMIAEAEAMDAVNCAPRELAQAQVLLAQARHELIEDEEDPETYIKTAKKAAEKLLASTRACYEARQKKLVPELTVSLTPTSLTSGDCALLSWSSANAEEVRLDPGDEVLPLSGANEVCPPSSTLYTLSATGAGGTISRSASLEVIETLADVKEPQPVMSQAPLPGPIYFDYDRDFIREDAKPALAAMAAALKADSGLQLMVEGHCDERGTDEYNMALGERRAAAAKRYLNNLGVELSRLTTISYGEARPTDPGHDEAAWALNRRVEFVVK